MHWSSSNETRRHPPRPKKKQKKMSRQGVECPLESGVLGTLYQICYGGFFYFKEFSTHISSFSYWYGQQSPVFVQCEWMRLVPGNVQTVHLVDTSWPLPFTFRPRELQRPYGRTRQIFRHQRARLPADQKKHQKIKRQHEKQTESVSIWKKWQVFPPSW
jgi:hypothetical protein